MIRGFEGCRLNAYQDVAGVWTIGYGHTGREVKAGLVWTQEQADAVFAADLDRFDDGVSRLLDVQLCQHEFDAVVSLAFNIGLGAFGKSTLLKMLNAHASRIECAPQFTRWTKAGGKHNPGLLARRTRELILFLTGGYP
jgi:lysozyme